MSLVYKKCGMAQPGTCAELRWEKSCRKRSVRLCARRAAVWFLAAALLDSQIAVRLFMSSENNKEA